MSQRRIWPFLLMLGWGLPLPVVVISSSISQASYTGNNTGHCWIATEGGLIWSFLGPVYTILVINTVILVTSAIRIATARKGQSQMFKLRGFLISAAILTPALGLPWLVSLLKLTTVGVADHTLQYIMDKFIDWVFICLNAPSGVIFLIIVANRVKEFRATKHKKEISTRLTSVTGGTNTLRHRPVPSGANKYRKPASKVTTGSNSKRLIPVHSERLETARFAAEVISDIDNDKREIPTSYPPRPNHPKYFNNPMSTQSSIDPSTYVCEGVDTIHKNPLYISIEDLTKNSSADKTIEENCIFSGKEAKGELNDQNLSTIEQGATPKERPVILEDLAIPNPLFDALEQIEVDVPVTTALSASNTSHHASTVSLRKLSSDNNTTFANINAGLDLADVTTTISPRVSPVFVRETDEGLLRRSLNKIRSSFKLSQTTIPLPTPATRVTPTPIELLPKPKQTNIVYPNKYIEHINKLYLEKKSLPAKKSAILDTLLTKPPKSESVSLTLKPKLPAPYPGSKVKNLMQKFDSINTPETRPIKKPPVRPPKYVPATETCVPSIKPTSEVPTMNIFQTMTEGQSGVNPTISSIVIDEQPLSLSTITTDLNSCFKTTSFTQVSEEVQSPTNPIVDSANSLPSPAEQQPCTQVSYPQESQPPVKLSQTSLSSTSCDEDDTSHTSSSTSSPTKSTTFSLQLQSDQTNVPNTMDTLRTTDPDTILKPPSPRRIIIRPQSRTYQGNTNIVPGVDSNSHSPVKFRQLEFNSLSYSYDQDTISNASSDNSANGPVSLTFRPPQHLTAVSATKHQATTPTNTELEPVLDITPSPLAKKHESNLSRTDAIDEHSSVSPIRPKLATQLNTGTHGAFTAPLKPRPLSTVESGSDSVARTSDSLPTRKRSIGKISDRITFFDNPSQSEYSKTLPRPAKISIQKTLSTAGITQSNSFGNSNAELGSEPTSPPTVKSPPVLETTEELQTEL